MSRKIRVTAALFGILGLVPAVWAAEFAPAVPADAGPGKVSVTLTLDKASYALGDEASAEVRLDNGSDKDIQLLELQLEARSLSAEIQVEGKTAVTYTVNRPNVFFNKNAGPTRITLGAKKSLVTVIPVPLIRAGKTTLAMVYKGAGPSPLRSNSVTAEVKAEAGNALIARIDVSFEGKDGKPGNKTVSVQLDPDAAPVHVMNFAFLARQGFYNQQSVYRVIPDFAIQTGCPQGSGIGDPGYHIANEHKPEQRHARGTVSMNHPQGQPDAAGSQFFICVKDAPWLDLPEEKYTVFGKVVEGLDVVEEMAKLESDPKTCKPIKPVMIMKVSIGTK
jgi:peptidyl-prolyl cis-trans isomerase B (cyclophilin B)